MKYIITGIFAFYLVCTLSSCTKTVYGCTDPTAYNYNASANQNNGSCVAKVYGCMDQSATNYNPYANEDDGSCQYNGQVVFWTNTNYGYINVTCYGYTGTITQYYYSGVPDCSSSGCAIFTLPVGSYTFYAATQSGTYTWNASGTSYVTVTANGCQTYELY
jgi:hypothetical protein